MFTKLISFIQLSIRPMDVRLVLFLVMLAMFILGAGAPSATGH